MRYKNVIQYYVVIGVCTIYWKDRREDPFLIQYIIVNSICQIRVSIIDSSLITSKIYNIYIMVKSYCVKEKKETECVPGSERYVKTKNGRTMMKCTCASSGITKAKFVKNKGN